MQIYKITPNSIHFIKERCGDKYIIKASFYTFPKFQPLIDKINIANDYRKIKDRSEAVEHYLGLKDKSNKYPQIYLTTDNFNTSTGEGHNSSGNQLTWAAARGATTGTASGLDSIYTWKINSSSWFCIRGFLPFLTSSISDTAVLSAADLNLYRDENVDNFVDTDDTTIEVVESSQASPTSLANGDFDAVSFTSKGSIDMDSTADDTYFSITITDLNVISLTSYTQLAIILGNDRSNTEPTGRNSIGFQDRGQANPPRLDVTYTDSIAYTKDLSETITISEPSILRAITKSSTETATITDTLVKGGAKTFSETLSILERFVGRFGRASSFSKQEPDEGDWTRVS